MTTSTAPPLVVLDCDGVLVDSEPLVQRVEMAMLAELGWPITLAEIQAQHLGRPWPAIQANIESRIGRPLPADFRERRVAANDAVFAAELTAVPGIVEALALLAGAGHLTCVASSGSHRRIERVLGLTGLLDQFRGRIFSTEDVARGKPAPDLFLHAAARVGVPPQRCVVVEDSPAGVAAAVAAGMPVVGFAGATPAPMLSGADVVIDDMARLPAAVARLTV
ncbi:HAD family hydrolase [Nocardioides nitrophenolicus]|uniref:HAD family hydrolase n=1 Tax=Nocardioides nitrophenolicus TaxID=60489 RepID=UPI00195B0EF6|nr:HAD family phosphatase [Nocardioides nitrophenolicus]MBM7519533.1 HAD superfamily hydrolase (TIGR01509 family) [Nocardioides nitrophenolicus]